MAENLGSIYAEFRLALDGLRADVAEARRLLKGSVEHAASSIKQAGTAMTTAGAGIATGLGFAVKSALDFEAQMSSIKAVSGATGQEMSQLTSLAKAMGAKTKFSSLEAAQGIEELIKAGVSVSDIINGGLEGALNLAVAGELDLADAAEIASTALNAFKADGLSVSDAADILAGAANASATSVGELKYGLSAVASVASGMGLSFKDTSTALAVFAQNGLKGSDAGTSLKTMLLNLEPSSKAAEKAMMDLGIITKDGTNLFFDQEGKVKSLAEISQVLKEKLAGLTDQQRQAALKTMFGTDAIRAANILYKEGAAGVENMWKAMSKVSAADVAAERMNNVKGKIEEFKGSLETAAITIGTALLPAIGKIVDGLQWLIDKFNALPTSVQAGIAVFAAIAAAILLIVGPIMILVGTALPGLITMFSFLSSTVLPAVAGAFAPITGVILGVIAVAALLYAAWKTNFGGLRDFVINVWNLVVAKFQEAKAFIMPIMSDLVSYITERFRAIQPVVQTVMNVIRSIIAFVFPFIYDTVKFYLNAAMNVFKGAFNIMAGVVKFFVALFTGDWKGMWAAVKQVLTGAVQAIWGLFQLWFVGKIAGVIGKFASSALKIFTSWISRVTSAVSGFVSRVLGSITGFVSRGISSFASFASRVVSSIGGMARGAVGAVVRMMASLLSAIGRGISSALRSFASFAMSIPRALSGAVSSVVGIGRNIAQGIWRGVSSMGGWLAGKLKGFAKSIIPGPIAKALGIKSPSRLMAETIGKYIPSGIAMGAEDNTKPLDDMSDTLAAQLVKSMETRMQVAEIAAQAVMKPSISQESRVITGTGQTIVNEFNGPLIGNATVRSDQDIRAISQNLYSRILGKGRVQGQVVLG